VTSSRERATEPSTASVISIVIKMSQSSTTESVLNSPDHTGIKNKRKKTGESTSRVDVIRLGRFIMPCYCAHPEMSRYHYLRVIDTGRALS